MSSPGETLEQNKQKIVPKSTDNLLNDRLNDGIKVQLFHRPDSVPPLLYVTVDDVRNSVGYDPIVVEDPSKANDIFHHAMTYISEEATSSVASVAYEMDEV